MKLRTEIPSLFKLAEIVRGRPISGVLAPKPPNSDPYDEQYVFDFVGMLGLPLVPKADITDTEAALLSVHALKDQELVFKLERMVDAGIPLLITDGLQNRLRDRVDMENVRTLEVGGDPRSLLKMDRTSLMDLREAMLKPFDMSFDAPSRVSLHLIGDDHIVIENFNDDDVDTRLRISGLRNAEGVVMLPVDARISLKLEGEELDVVMSPRSMIAVRIDGNSQKSS